MKLFLTILTMFIFVNFSAQIDVLKQNLLEFQQQVYQKDFSKKWVKTTQKNWEAKCSSANSIEELNTLFNQFSDLFAQVTDFSMGNSDAKTEVELAQYLLKVKSVIKKEYLPKWSETAQKDWTDRLNKMIEADKIAAEKQKQKEEGERQVKRLMILSAVTKDFESNFKVVFEDSKKNNFKTIRSGTIEGSKKSSTSSVLFNSASKPVIELDENNSLIYSVTFDTKNDLQLAEKIVEEFSKLVLLNVPSEFKKTNSIDDQFVNKNKFLFEYTGAKFSDTAKNPTITIGIDNTTKNVVLIITEPVFGK
jgi:hypothetical protein